MILRNVASCLPVDTAALPLQFILKKIQSVRDLCSGSSDFKMGFQPRTNAVKVEKGDLVTDCHSVLARWRNHFSQLLNVHGVSDVRHTEILTAEPLVAERSAFEVELAVEKLKSHKSPRY